MSAIIELKNINKVYVSKGGSTTGLKNISLTITKGEFISIVGQSGSGKTTLLNILGGLDLPTSGQYFLNTISIANLKEDELSVIRNQFFGFVFQKFNLIPTLSIKENIELPLIYGGKKLKNSKFNILVKYFNLENKIEYKPNELSGGQQQRFSILRAIINNNNIILADEPTGSLDSQNTEKVLELLEQLNRIGHTIILVTHDLQIAQRTQRIIKIKDGSIVSDTKLTSLKNCTQNFSPNYIPKINYLPYLYSIKNSLKMLNVHKLRTILTMIGIIIGICSLICVIGLGKGTQKKILRDIGALGTDTMEIFAGSGIGSSHGFQRNLGRQEFNILERLPQIAYISPTITMDGILKFSNKELNVTATAINHNFFNIFNIPLRLGRNFTLSDIEQAKSVIIIDANVKNELFANEPNPIGKSIIFENRIFQIIGEVQEQQILGAFADSINIWIPYTSLMTRISHKKEFESIVLQIPQSIDSEELQQIVSESLIKLHGQKDFFIICTDYIRRSIEGANKTLSILLNSIAFISLIVGGIGVMNIMLVSVTERTREIGIRKAIGARTSHIVFQFSLESILLCLFGGIIGLIFAYIFSLIYNYLRTDSEMIFSLSSVVIAIIYSGLIGLLFGICPAYRAAKLLPISALS